MIEPIDESSRIALTLEEMAVGGARPGELLAVARQIGDADLLFEVAGNSVHSLGAMRALHRRAEELGACADRSRGLLALAYLFAGDDEAAKRLVSQAPEGSTEPVLWQAWALTSWDTDTQIERLKAGIQTCNQPKPLWRQLATTAIGGRRDHEARRAHIWLLAHETDAEELNRLRSTMTSHGWSAPGGE